MQQQQNRAEIAAIVARLLNHYWVPDQPVEMWKAQIEDWIYDLEDFEPAIVRDACTEWRRQPGSRRPTPGDIYNRCYAARKERRDLLAITDERKNQWPDWLADIYGPLPDGPHKRAEHAVGSGKWQRLGGALSAERRLWYVNYYLQSPEWKALRTKVFARCRGICEKCRNASVHDVHHLTYERLGSENLSDLMGVCRDCHEQFHANKRK